MTWKSKHCKQTIEKTSQKRIPFLLPKSFVNIELEYGCETSGCPLIWIWRFSTNKVWTLKFCGNLQVYMSIPITWEFLAIMSLAQLCIGKQLKCREHVAEGGNTSGRGQRPRPSPVPPNLIMLTIFVLILFEILFLTLTLLFFRQPWSFWTPSDSFPISGP